MLQREQRQVLLELELTSTARAHAFAPVVTRSTPTSTAPSGDESPATYWRARFVAAHDEHEASELVKRARDELRAIRRRSFPATAYDTADELAERVVSDGESVDALSVAIALRCTPTFVRRARIIDGRDPEYGRVVDAELSARSLRDAGLSLRQVSAVLGVPRSTLHERLARAA
jgi:hypothetical protein